MKVRLKVHIIRFKNIITTKTLVSVFILLFLILSFSAVIDYLSRRQAVIDNMTHFTHLVANTIQKSAANSIISYNLLEHYIEYWFFSNLNLLDKLEKFSNIDNNYLANYAAETKIYNINFYDHAGKREFYSHKDRYCCNSRQLIEPILNGSETKLVLGLQPLANESEEVYVIAIARTNGGAIVGTKKGKLFTAIQKTIGIERYLNTMISDSSLIYIAIQDSAGTQAKTRNLDTLSNFDTDELLSVVQKTNQFRWRTVYYNNARIFEAILPLTVMHKPYGIIRIGLDYSPVLKMQKVVLRQVLIRLMILLIISFILISYSISIQNIALLEKEKEKITQEVYLLQQDLRLREKMSAVGELAAGVAHEIRNPLGAISMTVQRLAREFKPTESGAEQKRLFDIVRKEIDHISDAIKNLLQFSKPAPLQKSRNRLDKIIDKIVELYRPKANEAGITLFWSNQVAVNAFIDPLKIEECLINILDNAITATPRQGRIEIGLNTTKREIILTVKDTGGGISKDNLSKIFNLYFTTKANGTGFGLAHAQQIISEHGGKIRVDSRENQGTTFTIILPNDNAN